MGETLETSQDNFPMLYPVIGPHPVKDVPHGGYIILDGRLILKTSMVMNGDVPLCIDTETGSHAEAITSGDVSVYVVQTIDPFKIIHRVVEMLPKKVMVWAKRRGGLVEPEGEGLYLALVGGSTQWMPRHIFENTGAPDLALFGTKEDALAAAAECPGPRENMPDERTIEVRETYSGEARQSLYWLGFLRQRLKEMVGGAEQERQIRH